MSPPSRAFTSTTFGPAGVSLNSVCVAPSVNPSAVCASWRTRSTAGSASSGSAPSITWPTSSKYGG